MQITIDVLKLNMEQRNSLINIVASYMATDNLEDVKEELAQAVFHKIKDVGSISDPATVFGKAPAAPLPPAGTTITTNTPVTIAAPNVHVAGNAIELDKDGFPWDARIHSGNHKKVATGKWRGKRDVDPALVAQVEAELRAVMGAPVAQPQQVQVPTAPPAPPVDPLAIPVFLQRAAIPSAPSAPAQDAMGQYIGLISRASTAVANKKITEEQVTACCTPHGVPNLPMLAHRLDLLPLVAAAIDALIMAGG